MKESIKWRMTKPLYRAAIGISTIVGLATATGAPMKWAAFSWVPGTF